MLSNNNCFGSAKTGSCVTLGIQGLSREEIFVARYFLFVICAIIMKRTETLQSSQ